MKFYSIHNGHRIPYLLGVLIGFDQWLGSLVPGADVDRTISHRLGVKRAKLALRKKYLLPGDIYFPDGTVKPSWLMASHIIAILNQVRIPFWKHPLAATIDWALERLEPGHSIKSIGS